MAQKSLIDRIFGSRPHAEADEYLELDLGEYEEVVEEEPAGTYVKVAELINVSNLTSLKDEVYKGNIVIIDIAHIKPVSYTHLRAHETDSYLVCRLLLEKKKTKHNNT